MSIIYLAATRLEVLDVRGRRDVFRVVIATLLQYLHNRLGLIVRSDHK